MGWHWGVMRGAIAGPGGVKEAGGEVIPCRPQRIVPRGEVVDDSFTRPVYGSATWATCVSMPLGHWTIGGSMVEW